MKLLKKVRKSVAVRRLASFLITYYVKLVWMTSRWESINYEQAKSYGDPNKPLIICFWHGRLLMMFKAWIGSHTLHMLHSSHPDGEIIARTTKNFGFGAVFGSSTRGGKKAFLRILKILKQGESVGITPDGPRGPRYQATLGIIRMAQVGKAAILPIAYSSTRGVFMKTWDQFFLPLPFGKGVFVYGPILDITQSSKSEEELRKMVEDTLRDITQKADAYCGRESL